MSDVINDQQVKEFLEYIKPHIPDSREFIRYDIKSYLVTLEQRCGHVFKIEISDILYFLSLEEKGKYDIMGVISKMRCAKPQPIFLYVAGDPFW